MKNVTIVCDGSSLGNGRGATRAAAAAVHALELAHPGELAADAAKFAGAAAAAAVAELEADYDRAAKPLVASPGGGNALHHP